MLPRMNSLGTTIIPYQPGSSQAVAPGFRTAWRTRYLLLDGPVIENSKFVGKPGSGEFIRRETYSGLSEGRRSSSREANGYVSTGLLASEDASVQVIGRHPGAR